MACRQNRVDHRGGIVKNLMPVLMLVALTGLLSGACQDGTPPANGPQPQVDQAQPASDPGAGPAKVEPKQPAQDDPWPELTKEFGPGKKVARYWVQDEVNIDTRTRLMWEQKSSLKALSWGQAAQRCTRLELAGHKDWRMPTIRRLRTLFRGCAEEGQCGHYKSSEECKNCKDNTGPGNKGWFMQKGVWKNPEASWFWSATKHPEYPKYHWAVFFAGAYINYYFPNEKYHVRCVRKLADKKAS